MVERYRADRAEAREARDLKNHYNEQAASAQRTGDHGRAMDLRYKAETQRRRQEAAEGRSGGLD